MPGRTTSYSAQLAGQGFRQNPANTITAWPATLYIALLSANPPFNDMVSAAEAPYTGYTAGTSRQSIASSTSGWNAPSTTTGVNAVTMTNAALLTFPTATGSGSITGVAMTCNNATSGTGLITSPVTFSSGVPSSGGVIYWNSITTQTVNNTNPVTIAAGALTISED